MRWFSLLALIPAMAASEFCAAQSPIVSPPKRIDPLVDPNPNDIHAVYAQEYAAVARGSEVFAIWVTRPQDRGTGQDYRIRMLGIGHSSDGGVTWNIEGYHAPASGDCIECPEHNPFAAFDPVSQSVWVGGGIGFHEPFFKRRALGAMQWDLEYTAEEGGGHMARVVAGPRPDALDETRLYLFAASKLAWSDDFGDTWSQYYNVQDFFEGTTLLNQPAIGNNGVVYDAKGASFGLWLARALSIDENGLPDDTSFHLATDELTPYNQVHNLKHPGNFYSHSYPAIACDPQDGKRVFLVYPAATSSQGTQHNLDLYLVWTDDATADPIVWSEPKIIPDEAEVPGDQFIPWLTVDDRGWLHLLQIDSRHMPDQLDGGDSAPDGYYDFYYSCSKDNGDTWTEVRLTPSSFNVADRGDTGSQGGDPFFGVYNAIASAGNRVYAIYPYLIPEEGNQPAHIEAHVSLIVIGEYATIDDWSVVDGFDQTASLTPLAASDDQHILVAGVGDLMQTTITEFVATSPYTDADEIDVLIEMSVSVAPVTGQLLVRNWSTGQFEPVDVFDVPTTDTVIERRTLDGATYVRDTDGRVELRVIHDYSPVLSPLVSRFDYCEVIATTDE